MIRVVGKSCQCSKRPDTIADMPSKQITRNIALTPQLDQFVQSKLDAGGYQSASEVVREGLRLLQKNDDAQAIAANTVRQQIDEGYAQVLRGDTVSADKVIAELQTRSRTRRRSAAKGRA
jgi:antitoxin ParD1/3/4